jgi:hypothetical protein
MGVELSPHPPHAGPKICSKHVSRVWRCMQGRRDTGAVVPDTWYRDEYLVLS